ncbi:MAG: sulfotransferase domain-containing protein [Pseudomonadota bacterium]
MSTLWRDAVRHVLGSALVVLPWQQRKACDRWLRGHEEHHKLQRADAILMSWGKSGRTWFRVMLSRFYQQRFGIAEGRMLEFDNLHELNDEIPRLFFTHGNYLRNYTGNWGDKREFYGKRIIMLVRDPRDIAVSQYHQWKHRMRPIKKRLNDYPTDGTDVSLYEFMLDKNVGLPEIIGFFSMWERELPKAKDSIVIHYETMRTDPGEALRRALVFLGHEPTAEEIQDAVDYAAYDNMKKLEDKKVFWLSGARLRPGKAGDPNSYKVRRAKVGGYRDDFSTEQLTVIDDMVQAVPTPLFGYGGGTAADSMRDAG